MGRSNSTIRSAKKNNAIHPTAVKQGGSTQNSGASFIVPVEGSLLSEGGAKKPFATIESRYQTFNSELSM